MKCTSCFYYYRDTCNRDHECISKNMYLHWLWAEKDYIWYRFRDLFKVIIRKEKYSASYKKSVSLAWDEFKWEIRSCFTR